MSPGSQSGPESLLFSEGLLCEMLALPRQQVGGAAVPWTGKEEDCLCCSGIVWPLPHRGNMKREAASFLGQSSSFWNSRGFDLITGSPRNCKRMKLPSPSYTLPLNSVLNNSPATNPQLSVDSLACGLYFETFQGELCIVNLCVLRTYTTCALELA